MNRLIIVVGMYILSIIVRKRATIEKPYNLFCNKINANILHICIIDGAIKYIIKENSATLFRFVITYMHDRNIIENISIQIILPNPLKNIGRRSKEYNTRINIIKNLGVQMHSKCTPNLNYN